ncbi:RNA polymerase sigma factor SigJ [Actinoplanes sp. NPDC024001]|uniref:RNA polymerase sigma factor SigJ n=1 Tax=Actinoplanes sp. NPDC024001 TaxID=3154598 RepID=UPI0033EF3BD1
MTAAFTEHRGLLFAVAYRMLGSVAEAEDVVQEAWLRWSRVDHGSVADAEGYLVRVTIRLSVDQLRSARRRRESYVGPWLPEPLLTAPDVADDVVRAESVSTALLLIMESLTPLERAVFVLHEAFGYPYGEIGVLLGRAEPAVRQLARRARAAVEARERRYDSDPVSRRLVAERFLAACESGDVTALMAVLAPDVTMISDGGGLTGAPRKPIRERSLVARALLVLSRQQPAGAVTRPAELNGGPGMLVMAGPAPVLAMTLHVAGGLVRTLHVVSNPAKLTGVV